MLAGSAITAYRFKKLAKFSLVLILLGLVSVELGIITGKAYNQITLGNKKVMERRQFSDTDITRVLEKAPEGYRALVVGQGFQDNHYAYWYPIINGYSAIKLQTIQDAMDHLLFEGSGPSRLNWNVVNMLNGRYIIASGQLEHLFLRPLAVDQNRKEILYENTRALPKAWLIKRLEKTDSWEDAVMRMNREDFNPAILAYALDAGGEYSGNGSVSLESQTPNSLTFSVNLSEKQFVVISEMYYDEGWIAEFQGKKLPIYRVNYMLRGIELPAGKGSLHLYFDPPAYRRGLAVSWIGVIIVWILIGGGWWLERKPRFEPDSHA